MNFYVWIYVIYFNFWIFLKHVYYSNIENSGKYNLLMAIGEDMIYYEIKNLLPHKTNFFEFFYK
jgi:hypothetical protein